jgi:hypothetical protein
MSQQDPRQSGSERGPAGSKLIPEVPGCGPNVDSWPIAEAQTGDAPTPKPDAGADGKLKGAPAP